MGSVRALHGLHGLHGLGSSFYVDCDAFNNAVTASRRGSETFLEEEGLGTQTWATERLLCTRFFHHAQAEASVKLAVGG